MKPSVFRFYLVFSALLLLFYFAFASCYAMFQTWVKDVLDLNNGQIGVIYTLIALVAIVAAPMFGVLQDRLGTSKKLLLTIGIGMLICTPVMGWLFVSAVKVSFALGAIIAAIYLGMTMISGVGVVESYCERASRHIGFEYGNARLWGSVGYAASVSLSGFFLSINPQICFVVTTLIGGVFLFILWQLDTRRLQPDQERRYAERTSSLKQSLGLFAIPRFWWLTLFLFATSGAFMLYDQQFPIFYSQLFENPERGKQIAGVLLAVQLCFDASCLLVMPWLVNRIGARNGMLLAGVVMAFRILGSGMTNSIALASFFKLCQGIDVPLLIVSTFKYIARSFDSRYTSTVYLVSFQCSQQLCAILLSSVMGLSYAQFGFHVTYLLMGLVVAGLTVQAWFTLPRIEEQAGKA